GRGLSVGRVGLEGGGDDLRHILGYLREALELSRYDRASQLPGDALRVGRGRAGQHIEEERADREDVRAWRDGAVLGLLGGQEWRSHPARFGGHYVLGGRLEEYLPQAVEGHSIGSDEFAGR